VSHAKKQSKFSVSSVARKLVHKQLQKLHTGTIVIVEPGARTLFGEPLSPNDPLYSELHILDENCYLDIMTGGSIGAAEAYMSEDWSSPDLTKLVQVMVQNRDILDQMEGGFALLSRPLTKAFHLWNQNTEKGSKRNIAAHYDLGNDLFKTFLDPTMMYSSGIFPSEQASMEEASQYKLKTICEKLNLSESDHVVEIGSGWGGFAIYAAKHYGCKVTTTTISDKQHELAQTRISEAGLSDKITLLKQDYRELEGQFDKLVSIEMIEAVGWQYYDTFFATCASLLKPNGAMLIQAITIEDQRFEYAKRNVDFIQRYIFPGSCIPSIQALTSSSMKASDLRLVYQEDFAEHYARTLLAWLDSFNKASATITELGYSKEFKRMWEFYLCYCAGGFKERSIGVSHMLFAKPGYRNEPLSRI
jgi:cyclopropane-fatty-acyl-phospholipid synthase